MGERADRRHVGDHHAVDRPDRLGLQRAGADVGRLLAALVAADVDAVDEHARSRLQDRPGVARRRESSASSFWLTVVPVRIAFSSSSGLSEVTVITSSTAEFMVTSMLVLRPTLIDDVRILDGREALQLRLELVGGRSEAQEPELALGVGDLDLRRLAGVQGDGDAGQGGAGLIADLAVEVAGLQLGERRRPRRHQQHRGDGHEPPPLIVALHAE